MNQITKFQKRFCEALKYSGIKQAEIAKAAFISTSAISAYKSGKNKPSIDTLFLLCKALDVSANYLLGLED